MRWKNVLLAPVLAPVLILGLSACDVRIERVPAPDAPVISTETTFGDRPSPEQAAQIFGEVIAAVEPIAEEECRKRTIAVNCDFQILVESRRNAPANAFQSVDENGRPTLTFTIALIADIRNADEMAFVMGHEASHHIAGHLDRQRRNAEASAEVFGDLATLTGGSARDVANAQELGAAVGARAYSREFELEADELGTRITYRAGYNPMRGAEFFARIPDPGDRFLGSHPPNDARREIVRRTSAELGLVPQ